MNLNMVSVWSFIACLLLGLIVSPVEARESPFPGLVQLLERRYEHPFEVAGKVKESCGSRLLFRGEGTSIEEGQLLVVVEHQEGISPPLQRQAALIQVDALLPEGILAHVVQGVGRDVQAGDWVLTPPVPLVYLYTNIESKHTFGPYQALLKGLLAEGFQVVEITGGLLEVKPGPADLLLRLEGEAGHLVCQLTLLEKGQVLYSESLPFQEKIRTTHPSGHALSTTTKRAAKTASPRGVSPARESASTRSDEPSFMASRYAEKTDFYRLPEPYYRVVGCDPEGDGSQGLVLMGKTDLLFYNLEEGRLVEKGRFTFSGDESFPLHLHAMDLDGDGGDELLVTLSEQVRVLDKVDSQLHSLILTFKQGRVKALVEDLPFYLRVIQDREGKSVALAQRKKEYRQFEGPIYKINWNPRREKVEVNEPYSPARGIYSIYQFCLVPQDPGRVIILEPSDDLHGYLVPEETIAASGERNYGRYREMAYPIRLERDQYIGGFVKKTFREVHAPRRFELRKEFDGQSFLIYKERGGRAFGAFKEVFDAARGIDQLVGIRWMNDRIIETWRSKKSAKDVLDFAFLEWPGRVLLLYRDGDGYALEVLY